MAVYSKRELRERLRRFIEDRNRGISILMFSELAGVGVIYLITLAKQVFLLERNLLSRRMEVAIHLPT